MNLGLHTITVLRATNSTDAYGNSKPNWATPTATVVTGCSVQPVEGNEATVGRETVVSRWRVWAPDGTDMEATDRVRYDGDDYDVDGEVQRWAFPPLAHISALLRRSESH